MFAPAERRCVDQPGNGLVAALCGQGAEPMLQLVTGNGKTGQSVHIPSAQLPEVVWAMLERSGADPYELIQQIVILSVQHARPSPV